MLAHAGPEWRVPRALDRPPNFESHVAGLEVFGSKHWSIPSETQLRCHVYKARGVTQKVFVKWDYTLKKHVLKITIHRQF
jgi:hypothetical protein